LALFLEGDFWRELQPIPSPFLARKVRDGHGAPKTSQQMETQGFVECGYGASSQLQEG